MTTAADYIAAALASPDPDMAESLFRLAHTSTVRESILSCTACPLHETSTQRVPWRGGPSPIAILGEAPGASEDRSGLPFQGRAGRLLTSILTSVGVDPDQVAYFNTLCCRPPGNSIDHATEIGAIDACHPHFLSQLAAIGAWVVVLMGNTALAKFITTPPPDPNQILSDEFKPKKAPWVPKVVDFESNNFTSPCDSCGEPVLERPRSKVSAPPGGGTARDGHGHGFYVHRSNSIEYPHPNCVQEAYAKSLSLYDPDAPEPKSLRISDHRGKPRWLNGYYIVPTFHPAYALRHLPAATTIASDLSILRPILSGERDTPVPAKYDPLAPIQYLQTGYLDDKATLKLWRKNGYVAIHSHLLNDDVVVTRHEAIVPHTKFYHLPRYTVAEVERLRHMGSQAHLRRVHLLKRELGVEVLT
jgi:uracil-DNA glycosylase family 4